MTDPVESSLSIPAARDIVSSQEIDDEAAHLGLADTAAEEIVEVTWTVTVTGPRDRVMRQVIGGSDEGIRFLGPTARIPSVGLLTIGPRHARVVSHQEGLSSSALLPSGAQIVRHCDGKCACAMGKTKRPRTERQGLMVLDSDLGGVLGQDPKTQHDSWCLNACERLIRVTLPPKQDSTPGGT